MKWTTVVTVFGLLVLASIASTDVGARDQVVGPRTLDACEAETLDLKEALVKTQASAAEWQARAIRAEAQLALQVIQDARAKRAAQATESPR